MIVHFSKFHGAGNDFIMIDNRLSEYNLSEEQVFLACHRRFGIGADGLILLQKSKFVDSNFSMKYYNSDGKEGTMCGNGGRCIVAFASINGIKNTHFVFDAIDGMHEAEILSTQNDTSFDVNLKMKSIEHIESHEDGLFMDSGSPHFVVFVDDAKRADVVGMGKMLRHDPRFSPGGANVNFVSFSNGRLFVRTFERGVEDETLSCGTGVTASAIAIYKELNLPFNRVAVDTLGGYFEVDFEEKNNLFSNIWLRGPVKVVYSGTIKL